MQSQDLIGIDIGGTKCAVVLGDRDAQIRERIAFPTDPKRGPEAVIEQICGQIEQLLQRHRLDPGQIGGFGISCGGPLDPVKGLILSPPNLPGWDRIPIVRLMKERYGRDVYLQNDADACALAEWRFGAGRGTRSMIFLTFGTGFGAGLILDGRLYTGASHMAGEVGHIRLADEGPVGYGKVGSLEGFCSGGGIAQLARAEALRRFQIGEPVGYCPSLRDMDAITTKDVGIAAEAGDPAAIDVLERSGEYLGRGVSILIDVLNPERIVIGSVFARCERFLRPAMERVIREEALALSSGVCQIVPAGLGEQIGDVASLCVAMGLSTPS